MHLYIHIPFCKNKCTYCDFVSGAYSKKTQDDYIQALQSEMELLISSQNRFKTVYIGGGTPSALSNENLYRLLSTLQKIDLKNLDEFTIECNPESVSDAFVKTIKDFHIRRVSMGVQSANEEELRFLNRIHNFDMVKDAVKKLHLIGIDNISLDLMFHLPNQTMAMLERSLEEFMKLKPKHISCYSLIIEENTPMMKLLRDGKIKVQRDEFYVKQQRFIADYLSQRGFEQYEIASYALKGYDAIHNSAYWLGNDYLGLGLSAHSKIGNIRYSNCCDINEYIRAINHIVKNGDNSFLKEKSYCRKRDFDAKITSELDFEKINANRELDSQNAFSISKNKVYEYSPVVDKDSIERLSRIDELNELFFLGLRRNVGLKMEKINLALKNLCMDEDCKNELPNRIPNFEAQKNVADCFLSLQQYYQQHFQRLNKEGLLLIDEESVRLSECGREISNGIFVDLML